LPVCDILFFDARGFGFDRGFGRRLLGRLIAGGEITAEVLVDRQVAEGAQAGALLGRDPLRFRGFHGIGFDFAEAGRPGFGELEERRADQLCRGRVRFAPRLFQVMTPGLRGGFEVFASFGGDDRGFGFRSRCDLCVAGRNPRPGQRQQQLLVVGVLSQPLFDPFSLFFEHLGGAAGAARVADQCAEVDRADHQEEAATHKEREDRVNDPDHVFAFSPGIEYQPSLAA
jgi:hypothetical protein